MITTEKKLEEFPLLSKYESWEMPAASQLAEQDVNPDRGCSKVERRRKVRG